MSLSSNPSVVAVDALLVRDVDGQYRPARADEVLCQAMGKDLAEEFLRLKRMEWVEYQRHVSQWEVERYLEFF